MSQGKLGFGYMRLPVIGGEPTNIDSDQLNQMVDEFIGNGFTSLSRDEEKLLKDLAAKQKESGPEHTGDFTPYEGISYHGVSMAAILDTYNSAMVQPNSLFSGEMNYLANKMLSLGVSDIKQPFPEETVILDGKDITAQVKEAWDFLVAHAFVM